MNTLRALILLIALLAPITTTIAEEHALRKAPVDKDGRFFNPWLGEEGRSFFDFLRWKFSDNQYSEEKKIKPVFPVKTPDFKALQEQKGDWFVWLGHSTMLMRAGGLVILTDPVLWDVNFLVKRQTPLPADPESLPKVDVVLISHGHYDHLDTKSIKFLKERFDPFFVTGPGYGGYFKSLGVTRHVSLNWSEEHTFRGVKITSLPVQHWSKRTFSDGNKMLWCSFLVESLGGKYYWAGDTGYFSGFKEIGEKYGPIDVFFGPIGAYEPRWFMKENHMNPEEALKAASDLKARVFVPIHWGTFDLSDEPLDLPVKSTKELYRPGLFELRVLEHGGSFAR
jgi:L-ascorbate metabolism protein UlaG (beta-lactamase superfamily)